MVLNKMIIKVLKYFSVLFVFTLTFVILFNYYKIKNNEVLNSEDMLLKHIIVDHKINQVNFSFIKLNSVPLNLSTTNTHLGINAFALTLFIIPFTVIIYKINSRKQFLSEKSFFSTCFTAEIYKPPKYSL